MAKSGCGDMDLRLKPLSAQMPVEETVTKSRPEPRARGQKHGTESNLSSWCMTVATLSPF